MTTPIIASYKCYEKRFIMKVQSALQPNFRSIHFLQNCTTTTKTEKKIERDMS